MNPIITSLPPATYTSADMLHDRDSQPLTPPSEKKGTAFHYKKVTVPLAYPSEALREQSSTPKTYIYPPLMSPSDEYFNPQQQQQQQQYNNPTSPTAYSSQPINIPQGQVQNNPWRSNSNSNKSRRNSMPVKPLSSAPLVKPGSMPTPSDLTSYMPSPPTSPWKRSGSFSKPARSMTTTASWMVDETPFPELPADVRSWTSSHVAEYLAYTLRLYPRAITEDLGRYVRQSANLTGAQFIDLREEDLERMQINLKWRSMILKAVGLLRRETLRASRIDELNWEDGYDPDKDGAMPASPSSDEDASSSIHHSASATTESEPTAFVQEHAFNDHTHRDTEMADVKQIEHTTTPVDAQELRRGIVEDIASVLLSWKKDQEDKTKKAQATSAIGGLGFMEGVVIGGLLVAFMMRFSR
ncbi:hypothetical protein EDD11_005974 [Mortierella claussenii]|nr:hypothetical protein EDD11_005974 [Mortierella claussenii]